MCQSTSWAFNTPPADHETTIDEQVYLSQTAANMVLGAYDRNVKVDQFLEDLAKVESHLGLR